LIIPGRINIYSDYLVAFIQGLVNLAVLWAKFLGFFVLWWTGEVVEVVKVDKETRYCWLDLDLAKNWTKYLRTSRHKYIVIAKT